MILSRAKFQTFQGENKHFLFGFWTLLIRKMKQEIYQQHTRTQKNFEMEIFEIGFDKLPIIQKLNWLINGKFNHLTIISKRSN